MYMLMCYEVTGNSLKRKLDSLADTSCKVSGLRVLASGAQLTTNKYFVIIKLQVYQSFPVQLTEYDYLTRHSPIRETCATLLRTLHYLMYYMCNM